MVNKITLGNRKVKDAVIDWHVNASNSPTLYAILEEDLPTDKEFEPVEGKKEDKTYLSEIDGLHRGWQKSLPVSEETGSSWKKKELNLENGEKVKVYQMLHHIVLSKLEKKGRDAIEIRTQVNFGSMPEEVTVDLSKVRKIIETFINGDHGTKVNSYWYRKNNGLETEGVLDDNKAKKSKYPVFAKAKLKNTGGKRYSWKITQK